MNTTIAIVREVSASITACELTHQQRQPIDIARARQQHHQYTQCLRDLDCNVIALPEQNEFPDAVFIEDTAVVLDEIAIITRPGAPSRRDETNAVADALQPYRTTHHLTEPATLDGGDVIVAGKHIFVGLSSRSNNAAIEQVHALVDPLGYTVNGVTVTHCLHLKSAATCIAPRTILANPEWVDTNTFNVIDDVTVVTVDPTEPDAANAARVNDHLLFSDAYPRTKQTLEQHGLNVRTVDISELAKAESAVTCSSLVFRYHDIEHIKASL